MPFARVNSVDLYYELHGDGDPLLLIPGLGSDANTWASFLPSVKDFRSIILENRGSGRSTKPLNDFTTDTMAEDAVALMDRLGVPSAHIIGKSLGGMIAQIIAARYPARVRSLVLACTLMKHDAYGAELLELGRIVAEKAGLFAAFRQAFLLSYSREYCMRSRERLAQAEALLQKVDQNEMLRGYLAQSFACQKHDSTGLTAKIQAPSLVIGGKQDTIIVPAASEELASSIPRCEIRIFENGGHGFWREFPEEVNPVVRDFLTRH